MEKTAENTNHDALWIAAIGAVLSIAVEFVWRNVKIILAL